MNTKKNNMKNRSTMNKKILGLLMVGLLGLNMYAAMPIFASSQPASPVTDMKSVNGSNYMSTGSDYSSKVYEVGSESPTSGPRRSKMDGGSGGFPSIDPENPQEADTDPDVAQHGPIGDAVLPLMLMAVAGAGFIALRRRRAVIGK